MSRHPAGARGFAISMVVIGGVCIAALAAGAAIFWALQTLYPGLPTYIVLALWGFALIPALAMLARLHPFLRHWYYFLPALLFLFVFTIYPIFLTIVLAFTDYSGSRSGQPNRATQTEVIATGPSTLILEAPVGEALGCEDACAGQRIELQSDTEVATLRIVDVSGAQLTLAQPLPFQPERVSVINDFSFVGFRNFTFILERASRSLIPVFTWNVVFAVITVVTVGIFGVLLAILLNNPALKLRGAYRTLLIISWAVPGVISIQMWQALLNYQFGSINRLLGLMGIYPIPWLLDPMWAKVSVLLVNFWLGFPFMMVAALGVLATIPDELYEAAKIDGASPVQALRSITLPLLYPPMLPVLLTGFAFNFNNFNVIFLLTAGGPAQEGRLATAQATDILISWAYKTAFSTEGQTAYGLGAAISILIFFVTVAISAVNFRATGVLSEAKR